jgi:hypothetical protein
VRLVLRTTPRAVARLVLVLFLALGCQREEPIVRVIVEVEPEVVAASRTLRVRIGDGYDETRPLEGLSLPVRIPVYERADADGERVITARAEALDGEGSTVASAIATFHATGTDAREVTLLLSAAAICDPACASPESCIEGACSRAVTDVALGGAFFGTGVSDREFAFVRTQGSDGAEATTFWDDFDRDERTEVVPPGALDASSSARFVCASTLTSIDCVEVTCTAAEPCSVGAPISHPAPGTAFWRSVTVGGSAGTDGPTFCALTDAGQVFCAGKCEQGQCGQGSIATTAVPLGPVVGDLGFQAVDAEDNFVLALSTSAPDPSAYGWGHREPRTLEEVGGAGLPSPTALTLLDGGSWSQLAAGSSHACGVRDGEVECWGRERANGAEDGAPLLGVAGPRTGDHPPRPIEFPGAARPLGPVAVSRAHICAIDAAGGLWCWGAGRSGQCGDGSTVDHETPVRVGAERRWARVFTGFASTCALTTGGALYCWGGLRGGASIPERVCL